MDYYDAWNDAVEDIKKQVTGVGVWTAINVAIPITMEEGTFVLGVPHQEAELKGHLNISGTRRIIEKELEKRIGRAVALEVIDGITINDWRSLQRRKEEADRMRTESAERDMKATQAIASWDGVFEQISREYSKMTNKAYPQSRARLLETCINLCADVVRGKTLDDDGERGFARCIERISTYVDAPPTIIARLILEAAR